MTTKTPPTQMDSNKRLAAYLVAGACAYFLERAQAPPHGWVAVLLAVGMVGNLSVIYRAFIDGTDPEAKAAQRAQDAPDATSPAPDAIGPPPAESADILGAPLPAPGGLPNIPGPAIDDHPDATPHDSE